jgi:hypothetical protein
LSSKAHLLRAVHNLVAIGELVCLGYVWFCALDGRRDRRLALSVAVLGGEGAALVLA